MPHRTAPLAALLVAALTATAARAGTEITVIAEQFSFKPATVEAEGGAPITITFANKGALSHNLTFPGLDAKTKTIQSGDTVTVTLAPKKPGTYPFVCTVSGHKQAGMKGKLVVE